MKNVSRGNRAEAAFPGVADWAEPGICRRAASRFRAARRCPLTSSGGGAGGKGNVRQQVYIQDKGPTNNVPGAVEAKKESFVTTVSPRSSSSTPRALPSRQRCLQPDFSWYHSASSEDNLRIVFGVNFGGTVEERCGPAKQFPYITRSEGQSSADRDIPAIAHSSARPPRCVRVSQRLRVTKSFGKWCYAGRFAYVHNFKTDLRSTPVGAP